MTPATLNQLLQFRLRARWARYFDGGENKSGIVIVRPELCESNRLLVYGELWLDMGAWVLRTWSGRGVDAVSANTATVVEVRDPDVVAQTVNAIAEREDEALAQIIAELSLASPARRDAVARALSYSPGCEPLPVSVLAEHVLLAGLWEGWDVTMARSWVTDLAGPESKDSPTTFETTMAGILRRAGVEE